MPNFLVLSQFKYPNTIKVYVDFYNDVHRDLLVSSSAKTVLKALHIPGEIDLSTVELLTYYLFYKKRPGVAGFTKYREIRSKIHHALIELSGLVSFENESLCATSPNALNRSTTERLGEAIGLSVISKIHGLIEADWGRIQETSKRKTLDCEYAASDGSLIIKTETKGTICNDNRKKTSSVAKHKESIRAKKLAERGGSNNGLSHAMLYGTIAALDSRETSIAQCWLLDPPTTMNKSPKTFRIITRMSAIAELITFINPQSRLSASLQTRVVDLKKIDNIEILDGVPLWEPKESQFSDEPFYINTHGIEKGYNYLLASKSLVIDSPVGGQVFQIDRKHLFFIGIQSILYNYAIQQSFETIDNYKFEVSSKYRNVICTVPLKRFKSEFALSDHIDIKQSGKYIQFKLKGQLYFSSGGLVFGILPLYE